MLRRCALYGLSVLVTLGIAFVQAPLNGASEARLIRYPHYHAGKITFTYLGDVWTADETGKNVQRLTVNKARDVYPRFSPDGKWIRRRPLRNDKAGC